jgi:hypothetical protein
VRHLDTQNRIPNCVIICGMVCMFLVIPQIDWPKLHGACIVWAHAELQLQASLDISKPNFSTGTD